MRVLTEDATMVCNHETGQAPVAPSQSWMRIDGRRVLVEPDPVGRSIVGCPLVPPMKPCTTTLAVQQGYSVWIRIDGRRVCLDGVSGLTDGTPPGVVRYKIRRAGQSWVGADT